MDLDNIAHRAKQQIKFLCDVYDMYNYFYIRFNVSPGIFESIRTMLNAANTNTRVYIDTFYEHIKHRVEYGHCQDFVFVNQKWKSLRTDGKKDMYVIMRQQVISDDYGKANFDRTSFGFFITFKFKNDKQRAYILSNIMTNKSVPMEDNVTFLDVKHQVELDVNYKTSHYLVESGLFSKEEQGQMLRFEYLLNDKRFDEYNDDE